MVGWTALCFGTYTQLYSLKPPGRLDTTIHCLFLSGYSLSAYGDSCLRFSSDVVHGATLVELASLWHALSVLLCMFSRGAMSGAP